MIFYICVVFDEEIFYLLFMMGEILPRVSDYVDFTGSNTLISFSFHSCVIDFVLERKFCLTSHCSATPFDLVLLLYLS